LVKRETKKKHIVVTVSHFNKSSNFGLKLHFA